jgi:hypothetical protein
MVDKYLVKLSIRCWYFELCVDVSETKKMKNAHFKYSIT